MRVAPLVEENATDGPPLPVQTWKRLWDMCTRSVSDLGLWARAEYAIEVSDDDGYVESQARQIRLMEKNGSEDINL